MAAPALVNTPALRVRDLHKRFGRRRALAGIDLELDRGGLAGLVGADGAGKSTLLRILSGVLTPDSGEVEVLGTPIRRDRDAERLRTRVGLLIEGLGRNLAPALTVRESLDFFSRLAGLDRATATPRREALLASTRLSEFAHRRVANLSGGMRQKLGLACVLLHEPELLLLDEPTTGVDPRSRREFWELLAELVAERGLAVLVATADLAEVANLDRATLLHHGRTIAHGDAASLLDLEPGVVATWSAAAAPRLDDLASSLELPSRLVEVRGDVVRVFLRGTSLESALDDPRLAGAELSPPDLEDVVVARLGATPEGTTVACASPGVPAAPRTTEPAIRARGLGRTFGTFVAATGVDLEVAPGRILGLLGANGAGKTTVVKMLVGLLEPSEGEATVAGFDVSDDATPLRRRIGYVSQLFSLHPDLTVLENLRLAAGIYGVPRRERRTRIDAAIDQADLGALRRALPPALPVGHRQRLAIACAILHDPAVLFLDEPTSGVDVAGRRRFWEILVRLARDRGTAVLLTTHSMAEADRCDELVLMDAGRVVAHGTPRALIEAFASEQGQVVAIPVADPRGALASLRRAGHPEASASGVGVRFLSRTPERDATHLRQHLADAGFDAGAPRISTPGMDDVFVGRLRELERAAERPDR